MPSFVVAKMYYNAATSTLRIVYVSGMVYDYKDVPEEEYLKMKAATSKGTYLNKYIKEKYTFEKIGD